MTLACSVGVKIDGQWPSFSCLFLPHFAIASLIGNRYTATLLEKQQSCKWRRARAGSWYLIFGACPGLTTLCRPNSRNKKTTVKLGPDWTVGKPEKEESTSFRQAFRIEVWLLFATKRLWGVGIWLRDAGRRLQSGLRRFRSFDKSKTLNHKVEKHSMDSSCCRWQFDPIA